MQITTDLVFVDVEVSFVKIKFNLAGLFTRSEATKVNLEARYFNFYSLFLILLGCFPTF